LTVPVAPLPLLLAVAGDRREAALRELPFEELVLRDRLELLLRFADDERLVDARLALPPDRFAPVDWFVAISTSPVTRNVVVAGPTRSPGRVGETR
jgi:hypothetical protein